VCFDIFIIYILITIVYNLYDVLMNNRVFIYRNKVVQYFIIILNLNIRFTEFIDNYVYLV